jgi:DNA-3-methyladenine glycosylase
MIRALRPVRPELFEAPVLELARALVGKVLVHETREGLVAGRIVETEAYRGPEDLASHSARGRRTRRNEVMYGPAGHVYMFMLYGTSWAFNVVAGTRDAPHAVLVRALEPTHGRELMAERRGFGPDARELTNGPGKLCAALGLDARHYGASLFAGPLWIAEGEAGPVGRSPRINIDYAGTWVARPWRFYERHNRYVSVKPRD